MEDQSRLTGCRTIDAFALGTMPLRGLLTSGVWLIIEQYPPGKGINMDIDSLLGLHERPESLTVLQMGLRAVVVFVFALAVIRTSAKRFLGRKTAFDFILAIMLGSILSRGINGQAAFFPTLVASAVLVWFHRLLAALAFHFHWVGTVVKGEEDVIVQNGEIQKDALHKHFLTERDLLEDLRLKSYEDPAEVKSARVERSGDISVIGKDRRRVPPGPKLGQIT